MIQYLWAKFLKKAKGAAITGSYIEKGSKIEAGSHVKNTIFGRYSFCGYNCKIVNCEVGSFCSIASGVTIGEDMLAADYRDGNEKSQRCFVGNDVWIGENVLVKQGVRIGHGAVVGMGSVLTKDVPPYEIWAGNPAKFIKKRFSADIVDKLLQIKWWELEDDELQKVAVYIREPLEFIKICEKIKGGHELKIHAGKMKILHCCLSCFYVDNFKYQENMLPKQNALDGHTVKIVASTEVFKDGKLGYTSVGKYLNEDGIEVTRVSYRKFLPFFVMKKLRFYKGVYRILENFKPDVIFFHGTAAGELLTIAQYIKKHRNVKLYIDSHEDFGNTARTRISKFIYKYIHGFFLKKALPYTCKLFYIGIESKEYLEKMYHIKENTLEWYPLGGIIYDDGTYYEIRNSIRRELGILDNEILFMHSGKMNRDKKTIELLKAFSAIKNKNFRLIIIGVFVDDVKTKAETYIKADERISYIGWKSGEELMAYLCAADVYLQPGTASSTLQTAVCCRCGVVYYPYLGYSYLKESGFRVKKCEDIRKVFEKISEEPEIIEKMKENSEYVSKNILDYKKLAEKIYV